MTLLTLLGDWSTWYQTLLGTAQQLANTGHPELAVVTAVMATEVATENVFSVLFKRRGIADLEGPVEELFSSFSLKNERIRGVYEALSGDEICKIPCWPRYATACSLRHHIVHRGGRATPEDATNAVSAAQELIAHLGSVAEASARVADTNDETGSS